MGSINLTIEDVLKIISQINSTEDVQVLLDTIIETARRVIGTEGSSLLLYDKEEKCLVFRNSKGEKSEFLYSLKVPKGLGIAGLVLQNLEPIIVNDALSDSRIYRKIDESTGFTTRNIMAVPMVAQGEVQGVLEVVNSIERDEFDANDLYVLKSFCDMAAIALKNRLVIDDLQIRLEYISGLLEISNRLSTITWLREFIRFAIHSIVNLVGVERASFVCKSKSEKWRLLSSVGFSLPYQKRKIEVSGILKHIIQTGKPILIENIEHSEFRPILIRNYHTKSFLCAPIIMNSEVVAILSLTDRKDKKHFNKVDLGLVTLIVNQIQEAYKSFLAREEKEKYEGMKRDLQIASSIQKFSLPQIPKFLNGLEIETLYVPSHEVGGDFYDMVYHSPDEISVLIADVTGKGISAALFMEFSKTTIASEIYRSISPKYGLNKSNEIIANKYNCNMFVELMLLRINALEKKITYSSAGHNRQFFYRQETGKVELLKGKGLPLGVTLKNAYISEETIYYSPGDMIVLYTDGVTETKNSQNEFFGEDRLKDLIETNGNKPIEEIKRLIKSKTDSYRGKKTLEDDFTLVLVRLL
ncbi:MAG: SpoIIE family protein phosphatase [Leptospiraceae bacterium]|nr:SpoIIE family protein phosphatase [Leptospiraceae bacterium]